MVAKWCDAVIELIHIKPADKIFTHMKYPRPEHLFGFWQARLENLEDLTQQLGTAKVKTVGHVLEKFNSVFVSQFRNMVHDILEALTEARDITVHLAPLVK